MISRCCRGWGIVLLALLCLFAGRAHATGAAIGGELRFRTDRENGSAPVYFCPLARTDIDADISGMFGRVRVRQVFTNLTNRKIEALYVFPLPENAAVDQMVMTVGRKRVVGVVRERQQARALYETAKAQGKVASLLDQERPNVFTQSVANILPGAQVVIEISLVQTVTFNDGVFTWEFPTVVGPRYVPGSPTGERQRQTGTQADTDRVPDASRLSPPIAPPTLRAGHTLGLTVRLSSGSLPLTGIESVQHPILMDTTGAGEGRATVTLAQRNEIPNRDFILRYRVGGAAIGDALFTYQPPGKKDADRVFSLLVTPPRQVRPADAVPKEMVFVIDRSGSMGGFPIEKAKATMRQAILAMNPRDTFNLLSFSGGTGKAFAHPVPNTAPNRATALKYLADLYGSGGTEMLPAIQEALSGTPGKGRIRVVCFMTDGYIGNEGEIIAAIQKASNARVFAFGIGTSVNRFLLDAMARAGRGAAQYVTLQEDGDRAVEQFRKRIQSPVLTDVRLDFHGLPVYDVFPKQIPDLFDAAPVIVFGRIKGDAEPKAQITLRGQTASGVLAHNLRFSLPAASDHPSQSGDALLSLWARAKADDLLSHDPMALQGGQTSDVKLKQAVTDLGVRYSLLTPFTSFVAVEDTSYTGPETPAEVSVPVEMPAGVGYEGAAATPVFATRRLYGISGSMASTGGATSAPTFAAQPGDPLIRITDAPADTRLIAAILPDGTTVPLVKKENTQVWEAHFDIPLGVSDSAYDVKVILVRTGGQRRTLTLHYRVDTKGALALGTVRPDLSGNYQLEIETDEEAARVTALLPNGERVEMTRANEAGSRYTARASARAMEGGTAVTFIVTDRAHNRTTITVEEKG